MPRYFFHLVEGERRFRDEKGRELPNLIEAHTVALDIISKCLLLLRHKRRWKTGRL